MSILFRDYELLAQSGLFDAQYYLRCNPEIAAHNLDPLMHYLEYGCHEGRNPSAGFDATHYLSQCRAVGEVPMNPLLHFITEGSRRGLLAQPPAHPSLFSSVPTSTEPVPSEQNSSDATIRLMIDVPKMSDGVADLVIHGGLSIAGWAVAHSGITHIEVAIDGQRVAVANCGIRRPDVAALYARYDGAMQSGYAAHVPPKALAAGRHVVTVTARDRAGAMASQEFAIDVDAESIDPGRSSLRQTMSQAEIDLKLAVLARLDWQPSFRIILLSPADDAGYVRTRGSLESLVRQTYPAWRLCVLPRDGAGRPVTASSTPHTLLEGYEDYAARVSVSSVVGKNSARPRAAAAGAPSFDCVIAAGDRFGCDALLEFALASGLKRDADFFYCDERRLNRADSQVQAYYKPQWSPDLLLSTNYIGRAWCADSRLVNRAGGANELAERNEYDRVLRLTEAANGIARTSKLLFESAENSVTEDASPKELEVLAQALTRRGIAGQVERGLVEGHYRVRRRTKAHTVSIIIPTCASGSRIKTCIETLRALTAHRAFQIVCIENIQKQRSQWKRWLDRNVDVVLSTSRPFNWSRFNNLATAAASAKFLLFLNDDVEIIDPEWLGALLEHAQRTEVGVVGPQLLYPDRTVQHAGVTLDAQGRGRHAFRHQSHDAPGYFGLALTQRNVTSVTGACLLTRRDVFERVGRFEEAHTIVNGDLDYCLKTRRAGLLNIYTPYARLIHHELASRSEMADEFNVAIFDKHWRQTIVRGDPYFSRHLSIEHDQIQIEREPVEEVYAGSALFARDTVKRILVIKVDHIGDCITALPAVQRLRGVFPAAQITVLAARATRAIWQAEPSVDEIFEFNFFHARSGLGKLETSAEEWANLKQRLAAKRFDLAIDLRKQPDTRALLQQSGAKRLAGFDHQGRFPWLDVALEWDEDVPLRTKRAHVSSDLNALIDAVAAHSEPARRVSAPPPGTLALTGLDRAQVFAKPLVCVHPAAGSEMRQWPIEKFAELVDLLLSRRDVNVALIGGADDADLVARLLARVAAPRKVFNLAGKIPLADLPKLLVRAALFVGNNSGPQHLAASLGVATIGVHSGVVDANEWGPAGPQAVAVRRHMSCSPCFIEHAKDCSRKLACLTDLDSGAVFDVCVRLLVLGLAAKPAPRALHA